MIECTMVEWPMLQQEAKSRLNSPTPWQTTISMALWPGFHCCLELQRGCLYPPSCPALLPLLLHRRRPLPAKSASALPMQSKQRLTAALRTGVTISPIPAPPSSRALLVCPPHRPSRPQLRTGPGPTWSAWAKEEERKIAPRDDEAVRISIPSSPLMKFK